jgi:antitoxin VapB
MGVWMVEKTASVFMIGRSQAVRIPKSMRLTGERVAIRRSGRALILEPLAGDGWEWLQELSPIDPDFMAESRDQRPQLREELDRLFR